MIVRQPNFYQPVKNKLNYVYLCKSSRKIVLIKGIVVFVCNILESRRDTLMSAKYSLLVLLIVAALLAINSVLTPVKEEVRSDAYNNRQNINVPDTFRGYVLS